MNWSLRLKLLLACALLVPAIAAAEEFPARQVHVVFPFAAGGSFHRVGHYVRVCIVAAHTNIAFLRHY